MKKTREIASLSRGSITVEASFVMIIAIFVVFTIVAVCFYMHNRAWYSAAAGETAITAATIAVSKNGEYHEVIEAKISGFATGSGFPASSQGLFSNSSKDQMKIGAKAKVSIPLSNQVLPITVDISSKVIRPTRFIRKIQALQIIKEQVDAG